MMDVDGATLSSGEQRYTCVDVSRRLRIRHHPSDEWVYLQDKERSSSRCVYVPVALFVLIHPPIAADSCNEAQSK
jgi:hypothetical protein